MKTIIIFVDFFLINLNADHQGLKISNVAHLFEKFGALDYYLSF